VTENVFQGLKTGADWFYVLEVVEHGDSTTILKAKSGHTLELETAILRPLIKGGEMKRYATLPHQRMIIFPYEEGKLLSALTMQQRFPKTWTYMDVHRQKLEKRDRGKLKGPQWYGYSRHQALTGMPQRKIVTPEYYAHASYCLDDEGIYYFCGGGAGGYGMTLKDGWSYEYVLGLLNSRLLDWYLHKVSVRAYQTAYMYTKEYIVQLPIRAINFHDPVDAAQHDRVITLVDRMLALHQELPSANAARKAELEQQIAATDAEIDTLVYELYDLTDEEIAIVEGR
jgi:hypothetical protein